MRHAARTLSRHGRLQHRILLWAFLHYNLFRSHVSSQSLLSFRSHSLVLGCMVASALRFTTIFRLIGIVLRWSSWCLSYGKSRWASTWTATLCSWRAHRVLETVHAACCIHMLYTYLILYVTDPAKALNVIWCVACFIVTFSNSWIARSPVVSHLVSAMGRSWSLLVYSCPIELRSWPFSKWVLNSALLILLASLYRDAPPKHTIGVTVQL